MAASDQINKVISKGFQIAGQAEQVAGLFGVSLFGGKTKQTEFTKRTNDVISQIRTTGIMRSSLGMVQVVLPYSHNMRIRYELPNNLDFVNTRSDSFTVPGIGMATSDIKRYGYGPNERKPYAPIYTDVNFSFIGDSDGRIHKFFYLWMNSIVNHHKPGAINSQDQYASDAFPYEVEYKDAYKADIVIYMYNEAGNVIQEVTLHDAYPVFVGDIQYSWSDTDSLVRIPVSFTFFNWSILNVESGLGDPKPTSKNKGGLGTLGTIIKTASAVQTLASIKKPQNIGDIINVVSNTKSVVSKLPF